ncbi:MAG: antibiotic biosynthesis monooxygenase [Methanomassiliicoccus sp.]|nr:antibiotic biosynthesis monooxygenase [Methanomassiliicoccus sp.]
MVSARIACWKFKPGMRNEGVKRMNTHLDELKAQNGFTGVISLLSVKSPDRVTVISFWNSSEAMGANQDGLFQKISGELTDILVGPPQVANQTVGIAEMAKIYA